MAGSGSADTVNAPAPDAPDPVGEKAAAAAGGGCPAAGAGVPTMAGDGIGVAVPDETTGASGAVGESVPLTGSSIRLPANTTAKASKQRPTNCHNRFIHTLFAF
jgi:hypothetical protein